VQKPHYNHDGNSPCEKIPVKDESIQKKGNDENRFPAKFIESEACKRTYKNGSYDVGSKYQSNNTLGGMKFS
jgi:hypothetical protein